MAGFKSDILVVCMDDVLRATSWFCMVITKQCVHFDNGHNGQIACQDTGISSINPPPPPPPPPDGSIFFNLKFVGFSNVTYWGPYGVGNFVYIRPDGECPLGGFYILYDQANCFHICKSEYLTDLSSCIFSICG